MSLEDKIKVMQAFADGKTIESKRDFCQLNWVVNLSPRWNWEVEQYRIKKDVIEPVKATKSELKVVNTFINKIIKDNFDGKCMYVIMKHKPTGTIYPEFYTYYANKFDWYKDTHLFYNEKTQCWEDWTVK